MRYSYLIICLLVFLASRAQNKPTRIGIEGGRPNAVGLNLELLIPSSTRVALTFDLSHIPFGNSGWDWRSYTYLELGGNFYLKEGADGLYGHLSYGRMRHQYHEYPTTFTNLLNIKLGYILGKSFYFRPEAGIGLNDDDLPLPVFSLSFGKAF